MGRETATKTGMGRPRLFAEDTALDAAMRVFWEKGYEGASLAELTEAMGINRSSMYATFGDKEALFEKAIARYAGGPAAYSRKALAEPTARAVVEALFRGTLELLNDRSHPRGCFFTQGALACGTLAEPAKREMIAWRKQLQAEIGRRLNRAQKEGDMAPDVNPGDLARYIAVVLAGLGVQAANGASGPELARVAEIALRGLPL